METGRDRGCSALNHLANSCASVSAVPAERVGGNCALEGEGDEMEGVVERVGEGIDGHAVHSPGAAHRVAVGVVAVDQPAVVAAMELILGFMAQHEYALSDFIVPQDQKTFAYLDFLEGEPSGIVVCAFGLGHGLSAHLVVPSQVHDGLPVEGIRDEARGHVDLRGRSRHVNVLSRVVPFGDVVSLGEGEGSSCGCVEVERRDVMRVGAGGGDGRQGADRAAEDADRGVRESGAGRRAGDGANPQRAVARFHQDAVLGGHLAHRHVFAGAHLDGAGCRDSRRRHVRRRGVWTGQPLAHQVAVRGRPLLRSEHAGVYDGLRELYAADAVRALAVEREGVERRVVRKPERPHVEHGRFERFAGIHGRVVETLVAGQDVGGAPRVVDAEAAALEKVHVHGEGPAAARAEGKWDFAHLLVAPHDEHLAHIGWLFGPD